MSLVFYAVLGILFLITWIVFVVSQPLKVPCEHGCSENNCDPILYPFHRCELEALRVENAMLRSQNRRLEMNMQSALDSYRNKEEIETLLKVAKTPDELFKELCPELSETTKPTNIRIENATVTITEKQGKKK